MADQLKNLIDERYLNSLANDLKKSSGKFNGINFKTHILIEGWEETALKERIRRVSTSINKNLPGKYLEKLQNITSIAKNYSGIQGFVFPDFVETTGLQYENESLKALEVLTQYSTSEFAIRPFIIQNSDVMKKMYSWSQSKNFHVRRLASEGCRPLLPWSFKLHQFVKDPSPIIPILENLKEDNEDYVYRSVANNLNDISKHHPDLVIQLCKEWRKKNHPITNKIIQHALRTLLKKGNENALGIIGYKLKPKYEISHLKIDSSKIKIGDQTSFSFQIKNMDNPLLYRIEYDLHYLKKNGTRSPKTFQISQVKLEKNQLRDFEVKLKFEDLTTRKHYRGEHILALKINGKIAAQISFNLI